MDRSESQSVEGFNTFTDVLTYYNKLKPELPRGVCFLQDSCRLYFKFVPPYEGAKRTTEKSGCDWSIAGINRYFELAWILKRKLDDCKRNPMTASQWDAWFKENIYDENKGKDDRLTYRQIFQLIEDEYFSGTHKFTGEKRDRSQPGAYDSFRRVYLVYFNKFDDWDKYPDWEEFKAILSSWAVGTKDHYECYSRLKKIASYCPKAVREDLLDKLETIQSVKPKPTNTQSIDWEQFLTWYRSQKAIALELPESEAEIREGWLWVYAMCVVYGLRPGEIMSSLNLSKSISYKEIKSAWGEKGKALGDSLGVVYSLADRERNKEMLLVLGNGYTATDDAGVDYWITTKTGGRLATPLIKNREILEFLNVQKLPVVIPCYTPKHGSKLSAIAQGFSAKLRKKMINWNCPVSQGYSFRHLGKMLGKLSGLPPSLMAESMGHSLQASEQFYNRKTIGLAIELAKRGSNYPLPLEAALTELERMGIDVDDPSVKAILNVVYQLD